MPNLSLKPSDILYSQNSIGNKFTNGVQIGEVLDDIMEDAQFSPEPIPRIFTLLILADFRLDIHLVVLTLTWLTRPSFSNCFKIHSLLLSDDT
jgi:hypothetical protein